MVFQRKILYLSDYRSFRVDTMRCSSVSWAAWIRFLARLRSRVVANRRMCFREAGELRLTLRFSASRLMCIFATVMAGDSISDEFNIGLWSKVG
jgi:hypothetical protein